MSFWSYQANCIISVIHRLFSLFFSAVIRQEQIQPVQSARAEQVRNPISSLVDLLDIGKFALSCNAGTVS